MFDRRRRAAQQALHRSLVNDAQELSHLVPRRATREQALGDVPSRGLHRHAWHAGSDEDAAIGRHEYRADGSGDLHHGAPLSRRSLGVLALTMCIGAPFAKAAPIELRVLMMDQPTPAALETIAALIRRFPSATADTDVHRLMGRPGAAVHVALGADALKALLEAGSDRPLLALLTSTNRSARRSPRRAPSVAVLRSARSTPRLRRRIR
jgi:hypothetical protein